MNIKYNFQIPKTSGPELCVSETTMTENVKNLYFKEHDFEVDFRHFRRALYIQVTAHIQFEYLCSVTLCRSMIYSEKA